MAGIQQLVRDKRRLEVDMNAALTTIVAVCAVTLLVVVILELLA